MKEVINATPEFRQLERMREDARHNEAAALNHAREQEREKWQTVVADKDARLADKDAQIAELQAQLEKRANKVTD